MSQCPAYNGGFICSSSLLVSQLPLFFSLSLTKYYNYNYERLLDKTIHFSLIISVLFLILREWSKFTFLTSEILRYRVKEAFPLPQIHAHPDSPLLAQDIYLYLDHLKECFQVVWEIEEMSEDSSMTSRVHLHFGKFSLAPPKAFPPSSHHCLPESTVRFWSPAAPGGRKTCTGNVV